MCCALQRTGAAGRGARAPGSRTAWQTCTPSLASPRRRRRRLAADSPPPPQIKRQVEEARADWVRKNKERRGEVRDLKKRQARDREREVRKRERRQEKERGEREAAAKIRMEQDAYELQVGPRGGFPGCVARGSDCRSTRPPEGAPARATRPAPRQRCALRSVPPASAPGLERDGAGRPPRTGRARARGIG
jgi:hypothetical protein